MKPRQVRQLTLGRTSWKAEWSGCYPVFTAASTFYLFFPQNRMGSILAAFLTMLTVQAPQERHLAGQGAGWPQKQM